MIGLAMGIMLITTASGMLIVFSLEHRLPDRLTTSLSGILDAVPPAREFVLRCVAPVTVIGGFFAGGIVAWLYLALVRGILLLTVCRVWPRTLPQWIFLPFALFSFELVALSVLGMAELFSLGGAWRPEFEWREASQDGRRRMLWLVLLSTMFFYPAWWVLCPASNHMYNPTLPRSVVSPIAEDAFVRPVREFTQLDELVKGNQVVAVPEAVALASLGSCLYILLSDFVRYYRRLCRRSYLHVPKVPRPVPRTVRDPLPPLRGGGLN
ncbi:MAG: hypothetical protein R3E01_10385 [Pirellulaceae bacterium]